MIFDKDFAKFWIPAGLVLATISFLVSAGVMFLSK